jgi:hypothetical protein
VVAPGSWNCVERGLASVLDRFSASFSRIHRACPLMSRTDSWMGRLCAGGRDLLRLFGEPRGPWVEPSVGYPAKLICKCLSPLFYILWLTSTQFTSTQSTFVMVAGGITLTINFLSPIEVSLRSTSYVVLIAEASVSRLRSSNSRSRSATCRSRLFQTMGSPTLSPSTRYVRF